MLMVTKVYKPNVKLMVEEFEWNPNVQTLDEAWSTRHTSYGNASVC
jgi:hypothetical protein